MNFNGIFGVHTLYREMEERWVGGVWGGEGGVVGSGGGEEGVVGRRRRGKVGEVWEWALREGRGCCGGEGRDDERRRVLGGRWGEGRGR